MGGLHEIDGRSIANDVLNMFVPVGVCVCHVYIQYIIIYTQYYES